MNTNSDRTTPEDWRRLRKGCIWAFVVLVMLGGVAVLAFFIWLSSLRIGTFNG